MVVVCSVVVSGLSVVVSGQFPRGMISLASQRIPGGDVHVDGMLQGTEFTGGAKRKIN